MYIYLPSDRRRGSSNNNVAQDPGGVNHHVKRIPSNMILPSQNLTLQRIIEKNNSCRLKI